MTVTEPLRRHDRKANDDRNDDQGADDRPHLGDHPLATFFCLGLLSQRVCLFTKAADLVAVIFGHCG